MANHVYAKSSFRFLEKFYKRHKGKFDILRPKNDIGENDFILWTCWFQGLESAPALVKACVKSAAQYAAGRRIIVITHDNLDNYVSLPGFILEKHKNGYIQTPHFADVLRVYLLYVYGGMWFDSTVFFTQSIPEDLLNQNVFFFKTPLDNIYSPVSNWFIIAAKRHNSLLFKLLCVLLEYWRLNNTYIDYFMFHYFLQSIISNDPECTEIFNKIPYRNNQNPHFLQLKLLFSMFDKELWEIVKNVSFCHKLTYKIPSEKKDQEYYSFFSFICELCEIP